MPHVSTFLFREVCFGKPCVRGMRWPVAVILDLLSSGMSFSEIIEDHPELEKEDIMAALQMGTFVSRAFGLSLLVELGISLRPISVW